jgi:hypothetical protein
LEHRIKPLIHLQFTYLQFTINHLQFTNFGDENK